MPGMDGIEVCERIKSDPQNKNIFICFLTARSEDYSQIAGLEAGGDDYVSKPIKINLSNLFSNFALKASSISVILNIEEFHIFIQFNPSSVV